MIEHYEQQMKVSILEAGTRLLSVLSDPDNERFLGRPGVTELIDVTVAKMTEIMKGGVK